MSDKMFALSAAKSLVMDYAAAEKLLRAGDGDAALLYICILKNSGTLPAGEAAAQLQMSEKRLNDAFAKLQKLGLLQGGERGKLPLMREEPPEYSKEDIRREMSADSDFAPLVREVENVFGKTLSPNEIAVILGLYSHLGLPAEVILLLVNHCVEEFRAKYGPGRLPTLRWVEKQGYVWAREELFSLELAEEYLKRRAAAKQSELSIQRMLGIEGRRLSPTESRYIASWTEMGFDEETLEMAFDRTVTKTGKLTWAYMNSIITSWHSKGLHTPKEILEGDGAPRGRAANKKTPEPAGADESEMEQMREYLRSLREKS